MATATATPAKKKKTTTKGRKSAATVAEKEIVEKVWAPKLLAIITENDNHEKPSKRERPNLSQLVDHFNKKEGTSVSSTTVSKWLKVLGWCYERVPQWKNLPIVDTTAGPDVPLDPDTVGDNPAFGNVPAPGQGEPVVVG